MTTKQVALLLNCSTRRVCQLGKEGAIKLLHKGGRGRGNSNLYDSQSVFSYRDAMAHVASDSLD
jgi:phage terminase Nu1 subunit (DNA packaging protein)